MVIKKIIRMGLGGFKRLVSFGIFSGLGVLMDILILLLLTAGLGLPQLLANIISSICGTTFVYFTVTRNTWRVPQSWVTYSVFVGWYFLIILLSSLAIQALVSYMNITTLLAKLLTIPFTFTLNYFFNRILFSSKLVRKPA